MVIQQAAGRKHDETKDNSRWVNFGFFDKINFVLTKVIADIWQHCYNAVVQGDKLSEGACKLCQNNDRVCFLQVTLWQMGLKKSC